MSTAKAIFDAIMILVAIAIACVVFIKFLILCDNVRDIHSKLFPPKEQDKMP